MEWALAYTKFYEQVEEPESLDKDRQEDKKYKEAAEKLTENFLKWRLSGMEEMKSKEDIVTISSSDLSEESDWDWEEYNESIRYPDSGSSGASRTGDGYKCKCRRGHKTKKATIACIAQEDYESEVEIWEDHVNELGKAIKRDGVSTRTLANRIRIAALGMGIRRENPAEPTFTGAALRPEAQECHQGDLYQEARRQSRQEGPPKYTYVYRSATNHQLHQRQHHQRQHQGAGARQRALGGSEAAAFSPSRPTAPAAGAAAARGAGPAAAARGSGGRRGRADEEEQISRGGP